MSGRDRHRTVISHVAPGPIPDVATLFGKLPLIVQCVLFCRSIYADISIGFRLIGFCRRVSAGRESFADAPLADSETGSPDSAELIGKARYYALFSRFGKNTAALHIPFWAHVEVRNLSIVSIKMFERETISLCT